MNGEVRYTTGKMTAGLESPTEIRERMSRLAAELADESRTVFYAGWSDTRMRWVVSNDRAEMVRDCATMEAVCPDWDRIRERARREGEVGDRPRVNWPGKQWIVETTDMQKQMAETDRRAEEFNRVHSDEDPQVKVVRVLEYRGGQSDVLKMLHTSTVSESKGIVVDGVELTELVRIREVL